jgi:hypothetical protein
MIISKEKILNAFKFIATNISCSILQVFILACLCILQFIILFIFGGIIYFISGDNGFSSAITLVISYSVIIIIYGIAWFVFWSSLFKDGIKWFYWRVVFSIIPLVVFLLTFDPTPNPMAMITFEQEPIFSCLVTGVILFPIYSVSIYKFILQSSINKKRNTIFLFLGMLLLGSLIFYSSWNIMHLIYK